MDYNKIAEFMGIRTNSNGLVYNPETNSEMPLESFLISPTGSLAIMEACYNKGFEIRTRLTNLGFGVNIIVQTLDKSYTIQPDTSDTIAEALLKVADHLG